MLTISEQIKRFLANVPVNFARDLTDRYDIGMECQVNVGACGGEPVAGKNGCFSDGVRRWSHTRIPRESYADPYFDDFTPDWLIAEKAEAIGMSGWHWQKKRSLWCGFDFDSITGHAAGVGITDTELEEIKQMVSDIPWVECRRSTGGKGLHLYVYLDPDNDYEVENHNVHAAMARAILGKMSTEVGFDFASKMDVCGYNIWVWRRDITEENRGLECIKKATEVVTPPSNWRDNLQVVTGGSTRVRVEGVNEAFETLTAGSKNVKLDDTHKKIMEEIIDHGYTCVWLQDHHCLQTHTRGFAELDGYKGFFQTVSQGGDPGKPNCYAFPQQDGVFRVYRFGNSKEHETWSHSDNSVWTYFNRDPDLKTASLCLGGLEDPENGGYVFESFEQAQKVIKSLGDLVEIEPESDAQTTLKTGKDGRLVVELKKTKDGDSPGPGWLEKKTKWVKVCQVITNQGRELENFDFDNLVRAMKGPMGQVSGWVIKDSHNEWAEGKKDDVRVVLRSLDIAPNQIDKILGVSFLNNWKLANIPFAEEFPGGRIWNKDAPQLKYQPAEVSPEDANHPHWDLILEHIGTELDVALPDNEWAREHGIKKGWQYLQLWVASMFREPYNHLPYLFMFGGQNSGKSIFHEAIALLMSKGVHQADQALKSEGNFNGELAAAVLCFVEEVNLSTAGEMVYNKIKDWVTAEDLMIHPKRGQPYMQKNCTHWVQLANDRRYCPVFPGDSRITMIYVPPILDEIPKEVLLEKLKEEAPQFMRTLMSVTIPPAPGRLRIPVIATQNKIEAEYDAKDALEKFLEERCYVVEGERMEYKEFFDSFKAWLPHDEKYNWSSRKVSSQLRNYVTVGRHAQNKVYVANISFEDKEPVEAEWFLVDGKLIQKEE